MPPKPRGPIQMLMPGVSSAASRSRIAATPLRRSGNSSHNSPVMVTACRSARAMSGDGLGKGGVEPVEAPPQRAGDLPHGDGAAVLGQRHLEVRAADVVAGCDGHGACLRAALSARLL